MSLLTGKILVEDASAFAPLSGTLTNQTNGKTAIVTAGNQIFRISDGPSPERNNLYAGIGTT